MLGRYQPAVPPTAPGTNETGEGPPRAGGFWKTRTLLKKQDQASLVGGGMSTGLRRGWGNDFQLRYEEERVGRGCGGEEYIFTSLMAFGHPGVCSINLQPFCLVCAQRYTSQPSRGVLDSLETGGFPSMAAGCFPTAPLVQIQR